MPLTPDQVDGLDVALNEASWHDLVVDAQDAEVEVLVAVLARDESGAEVPDPRATLRLTGCSRLVASYRLADEVVPLDPTALRELLRRNGGTPFYGWDFVDTNDGDGPPWLVRPSLELGLAGPGGHHLTLFQDLQGRGRLDMRVWFAGISVRDGKGGPVELDAFIASGVRWWQAMHAGERSDLAPSIAAAAPGPRRRCWTVFRRTPR